MTKPLAVVITTIQEPTECVRQLAVAVQRVDGLLIVVGDKKGPAHFDIQGAELISLEEQLRLPWALSRLLPTGHYARKNLGYLIAVNRGVTCIYETDDDNAPGDGWHPRTLCVDAQRAAGLRVAKCIPLVLRRVDLAAGLPLESCS